MGFNLGSYSLAIYKFRRRFAKLLIAIGLIYIGIAIGSVRSQPVSQPASQQFLTSPNSSLNKPVTSQAPSSDKILPTTSTEPDANVYASPIFVSKCIYQSIPYKTVYKDASWLASGRTITIGGMDGEQKICTTENGQSSVATIISPLDKTVTMGTYTSPSTDTATSPNEADTSQ